MDFSDFPVAHTPHPLYHSLFVSPVDWGKQVKKRATAATNTTVVKLKIHEYPPGTDDFFAAIPVNDTRGWAKEAVARFKVRAEAKLPFAYSESIELELACKFEANVTESSVTLPARCLFMMVNQGRQIGLSIRILQGETPGPGETDKQTKKRYGDAGAKRAQLLEKLSSLEAELQSAGTPGVFACLEPTEAKKLKFAFWADSVADELLRQTELTTKQDLVSPRMLFGSDSSEVLNPVMPSGLVVFAGETGTGKSTAAASFVLRLLLRIATRQASPPKLVTVEDPIEQWKFVHRHAGTSNFSTVRLLTTGIEKDDSKLQPDIDSCQLMALIAREKGKDVRSVVDAAQDALRQKPTVFYVGEVRDDAEWQSIISLAATGHLVVTTCHAATMVDIFTKIGRESVRSAEDRHALASSILAAVHLKNERCVWSSDVLSQFPKLSEKSVQTFPQLWRRTAESTGNFVVDGLSSLFSDGVNILSRQRLVKQICERQKNFIVSDPYIEGSCMDALCRDLMASARMSDIRG